MEFIIDLLAQGWSEAEILAQLFGFDTGKHSGLLSYASFTLKAEKVFPLQMSEA